ncbi:hypothetical protein [Bradyrhizobium sp. 187]|jgi:pyruvate carboxylase|uniref:hypothetical protein n=1 Tax=Bradyrhizobium sp. 187 TaxID=2782655 RepID=UPI001FFE642C|nr:hypothetical protein [Bradyrhizobium sp. 187]UPJ71900.1 hypothetical protein IVB19_30610 [Bradyrhizobium sp. 187]
MARLNAADADVLLHHEPGEEVTLEIEKGKARWHRLLRSATRASMGRSVFFGLNGQPHVTIMTNRKAGTSIKARRKAEDGDDAHASTLTPGLGVVDQRRCGTED